MSLLPYFPFKNLKPSEISKEFQDLKNEESDNDKLDLKNLRGNDLPEEVVLILIGMNMEKYIKLFKKMKIALDTFLNLKEADLVEVGIDDPKDREIIAKNLSFHQRSKDDLIICENHIEDLRIIKNVSYQLLLLQNYCAYVELQMRKQTLTDYEIDPKTYACTFLKAFAECALTQSEIISSRVYDVNGSEGLMDKLLKMYNLTLFKPLKDCLPKKKRKRKYLLKVMVVIGFCSLVVLTGRHLIRKS